MKNRKTNLRALVRRIVLVIAAAVLGLNAYQWSAKSLAGNMMPMPFGTGIAVIASGSMEPTLSVDDLVIVRQAEDYEVGDIVVFQAGRELIIHRIIEKNETTLTTQGDANNAPDEPIPYTAVRGRLAAAIPSAGLLVRMVKTPVGSLCILLAAILLIELSFRRDKQRGDEEIEAIKEEIRRLKEEQDDGTDN